MQHDHIRTKSTFHLERVSFDHIYSIDYDDSFGRLVNPGGMRDIPSAQLYLNEPRILSSCLLTFFPEEFISSRC